MYTYLATLVRVVDGDTVDIAIDLGFSVTSRQRVRLLGLDAPERYTIVGKAAAEFVVAWFQPGPFTVESSRPGGGDKYGRYLARIVQGDRCLNNDLIGAGHAVSWDGQGAKP